MNGHIDFGGGIRYDAARDVFQLPPEPAIGRPLTAVVEVTYACNLSCGFCMKDGEGKVPTFERTAMYLSRLASPGQPFRTIVSGGEPFIRKDIAELLAYGASLGHAQQVVTNGTLLPPTRRFTESVNMFEIGLDGPSPEIYAAMRGRDSFREVTRTIRELGGLGAQVRVTYLLTKINHEAAKAMPRLCRELGVTRLRLQRFMRYGRGMDSFERFELDDAELAAAVGETRLAAMAEGIELRTPPATSYYHGSLVITPRGDIVWRKGDGGSDATEVLGNLGDIALQDVWTPAVARSHAAMLSSSRRL